MRAIAVSVGPLAAASANNIALSQSLASAGALIINGAAASGGVATLDKARRVIITSSGNDSGMTFTITGTDWAGNTISETIAGGNIAAASSVLDYLTVTSIVGSAATAGTVTAGTNGVAASPWIRFDEYALGQTTLQFAVQGTANFSFQHSNDDPNDPAPTTPIARSAMTWDTALTTVTNATATTTVALNAAPRWGRVLLNSGGGSVTLTATQFGMVPQ